MADDETPRTMPAPEAASTTAPVVTATVPTPVSPSVHGSALWGGPQFVANATTDPVWVETKQDYWDLMNRTGFRMKDQQESTTGPERPYVPWIVPEPVIERQTPPLTRPDAEAICAASAVWFTHGIVQTFWCPTCFALGRASGTRSLIRSKVVMIECRCGKQEYRPPLGTTDLPTKLANIPHREQDRSTAIVTMGEDRRVLPTTTLQRQEVRAIRAYAVMLERYGLQARLFCEACWNHTSFDEDLAMRISLDSGRLALACDCRMFVGSDAQ
jgi:hypothetical protein